MRKLLALFLFLMMLMPLNALAQSGKKKKRPKKKLPASRPIKPKAPVRTLESKIDPSVSSKKFFAPHCFIKGPRFTHNVMFLFDNSGSMGFDRSRNFHKAIGDLFSLSSYGTDQSEMAVITWGGKLARLKVGKKKWVFPSPYAQNIFYKEICRIGTSGATPVLPAIKMALQEKKANLTIVILTDGYFDEKTHEIVNTISKYQKKRKKKWGEANLVFYGVGKSDKGREMLKTIASDKRVNAAYYGEYYEYKKASQKKKRKAH